MSILIITKNKNKATCIRLFIYVIERYLINHSYYLIYVYML